MINLRGKVFPAPCHCQPSLEPFPGSKRMILDNHVFQTTEFSGFVVQHYFAKYNNYKLGIHFTISNGAPTVRYKGNVITEQSAD